MRWIYVPDLIRDDQGAPVSGTVGTWFDREFTTQEEIVAAFPDIGSRCVPDPELVVKGGGWRLVAGVWTEPEPTPESYTTITSYEFFNRWTKEERTMVRQLKAGNDDVADWYDLAVAAQVIEIDNPITIGGVELVLGAMLQLGFYPDNAAMEARKAAILAT